MNRPLRFVSALAAMALAPTAHALQFNFTILFSSGPLSGQSAVGQLETTAGSGQKSPSDGSLVTLTVNVDGQTFTAVDELGYPTFPVVEVSAGETTISSLEYLSNPLPSGATLSIGWSANLGINEVIFVDSSAAESLGKLPSAPTVVVLTDSSATGLMLAAGTAGLAMARRRSVRR